VRKANCVERRMKRLILIVTILVASFLLMLFKSTNRQEFKAIPDIITVGTSADFQPMAFKKEGAIVGFDIDLINEIGKRLNRPIVLKDMPFEVLLPQIQLGSIHIIAAGMSATPERAKRVFFSKPYITDNPLVAVTLAKNGKLASFDALKTKNVVVNQGYVADLELSKIPDIQLTRLATVADALMSLDAQRSDVFVTAASSIKPVIETKGDGKYELFILNETNENTALAISKEYAELARQIDILIDEMTTDGTLATLKQKWHLT
jgi:polar amino acid transport system substrate-binding protein